jgi:4-coumarate--CoA ligase
VLTRHSAYVVADQKQITGDEIIDWFKKQNLAKYKQLRGGVVFIEAIPKSPSGKILRKELREMAKKEFQTSKL